MKNAITWFEIPVRDMDRAVACYETLMGAKLRRETFGGMPYAIFAHDEAGVGGALVQDPRRTSGSGTLVYLNAEGELDSILGRVEQARGRLVLPKTAIGADGYIAIVSDSEGNHVGLNSPA